MYFEILSGGDVLKWEAIEGIPVSIALTKLALEKEKKEYERRYRQALEQVAREKQKRQQRRL